MTPTPSEHFGRRRIPVPRKLLNKVSSLGALERHVVGDNMKRINLPLFFGLPEDGINTQHEQLFEFLETLEDDKQLKQFVQELLETGTIQNVQAGQIIKERFEEYQDEHEN